MIGKLFKNDGGWIARYDTMVKGLPQKKGDIYSLIGMTMGESWLFKWSGDIDDNGFFISEGGSKQNPFFIVVPTVSEKWIKEEQYHLCEDDKMVAIRLLPRQTYADIVVLTLTNHEKHDFMYQNDNLYKQEFDAACVRNNF